jgi:hypothetical protein
MRPGDTKQVSAVLASGAAVGLGARAAVALRDGVGHGDGDAGEEGGEDDGETHGGVQVEGGRR